MGIMNSGQLRHRIVVQNRVSTVDSFGDEHYTWADKANAWGSIKSEVSKEQDIGDNYANTRTVKVKIRYRADIDTEDRILMVRTGKYYMINSIQDEWGRFRELVLTCTESEC